MSVLRNCVLTLLNIPTSLKETSKLEQYEISTNASLKARLHITYYMAKALESIVEKDEAVELCKGFIDYSTEKGDRVIESVENIEDLFTEKDSLTGEFSGSFNFVSFVLDTGRVGKKIKRCRWAEILKEVADEEYAYAVACHYDFLAAKKMNPNFELTRTKTITTGNGFCDFIWHDKTKVFEIKHEGCEFWNSL